jgi:hypothetical protein
MYASLIISFTLKASVTLTLYPFYNLRQPEKAIGFKT